MCTAIFDNGLFGRTLDLEYSLDENVVITPRKYKFPAPCQSMGDSHFAMVGSAHIFNGMPLYYDGINECGLAIAALNFPHMAVYRPPYKEKKSIASFELIPTVLGQCEDISSAISLLRDSNITTDSISAELPATPLHWMIADKSSSICIEPMKDGIHIQENPVGILTNSPSFEYQLYNLSQYLNIDSAPHQNRICPYANITPVSEGTGGIGLPGDLSSQSRFVRASFAKSHAIGTGEEDVSRFFHIADSVSVTMGNVKTELGKPVSTVYTSCMDTKKCVYYFTTYGCRRIRAVDLYREALDGDGLMLFPHRMHEDVLMLN